MTLREHDRTELGSRVASYLYVDNELPVTSRIVALACRALPPVAPVPASKCRSLQW